MGAAAEQLSEFVVEFIVESLDDLGSISSEILNFEKNPSDIGLIEDVFRKVHSLKGGAGFAKFDHLAGLSHSMENVLDLMREQKLVMNSDVADVLLATVDILVAMLEYIRTNTVEDLSISYQENIVALNRLLETQVVGVDGPMKDSIVGGAVASAVDKTSDASSVPKVEVAVSAQGVAEHTPMVDRSELEAVVAEVSKPKVQEPVLASTPGAIAQKKQLDPKKDEAPVTGLPKAEGSIRVDTALLDKMMNIVSELVLNRNQIIQLSKRIDKTEFNRLAQQLDIITTELQSDVMKTRMQHVGTVFNRFDRIVRDLSKQVGKKIRLEVEGKQAELDKTLLEAIRDPLTHVVRNSVDHGIEMPEVREAAGKPSEGLIRIRAFHESGRITIEIADDGAGLSRQRIVEKALSKGLINPEDVELISDHDIYKLIFRPGFSTAAAITSISGRGVGMDVVKTNVEKIGGVIDISSKEGSGTVLQFRIPLTLAIIPALIVRGRAEFFAIPQANLVELVRVEAGSSVEAQIERLHNTELFRLRGKLIPLLRLNDTLELSWSHYNDSEFELEQAINIVVLQTNGREYGVIVDEILDTEEIVVKSLSRQLNDLSSFAGSTIMGDGNVALIIDVPGFAERGRIGIDNQEDLMPTLRDEELLDSHEILLFTLHNNQEYGVPLVLINRLEDFAYAQIEYTGDQRIVRYRNYAMPIMSLEMALGFSSHPPDYMEGQRVSVLVVQAGERFIGLEVSKIIDITVGSGEICSDIIDRTGILGTLYLAEKTTTIIDVFSILEEQKIGRNQIFSQKIDKHLQKKRALIVEDSSFFRRLNAKTLAELGMEVVLASDGVEGLEQLRSGGEFDVVITDLEMPNMDGIEMMNLIQDDPRIADIPIVALSSRSSMVKKAKFTGRGFDCILDKFSKGELQDILRTMLV